MYVHVGVLRTRTLPYFGTEHHAAILPPSSSPAASSSSQQLSSRVAAVAVADCFDRSRRDALPAHTPLSLAAAATTAPAGVKCTDRLNIMLGLKRSL